MSGTMFEERFDTVVGRLRLTKVLHALCCLSLLFVAGVVVLSAADYQFELGWSIRLGFLLFVLVCSLSWGLSLALRSLRRSGRRRTAARIEEEFSQLGQIVRTSVQFEGARAEDANAAGASPTLVKELAREAELQTSSLPLEDVIPRQQLWAVTASLLLAALLMLGACFASWQWRVATSRALLVDTPYTSLVVEPGNVRVEEAESLTLAASLTGRTDRKVALWTRRLSDARSDWTRQQLTSEDIVQSEPRFVRYQAAISGITEPFDYRIVAGKYESSLHHVEVRYPVSITSATAEVTPPDYTQTESFSVDQGNLSVPANSVVQLRIELDQPAEEAWLETWPLNRAGPEKREVSRVECSVEGRALTAELRPAGSLAYAIVASTSDERPMRPNRFRIRVRQDRPPRLSFDRPDDDVEVTPLAEVLLKLRVSDDYGVARAGIVVQINNEDEFTLQSWPAANSEAKTKEAVDRAGGVSDTARGERDAKTRIVLERLLPIEYFELTQRDSISYYAFADDNRPGGGQRTESDLQFIDIRPFLRRYPIPEDGLSGGGGNAEINGPQFAVLEELIGRQRFILNRTLRVARRSARDRRIDLARLDQLVEFQSETGRLTGELAVETARIEDEIGVEENRISDLFFVAEEQMLAAVDSISVGKYDNAVLQEKDAVRHLIEARNRVQEQIGSGRGGSSLARELYRLSRRMRQRLRRPRTEEDRAMEIARELRSSAARQDYVAQQLDEIETYRASMPSSEREDVSSNSDDDASDPDEYAERQREAEDEQAKLVIDLEEIDRMIGQLERATDLVGERSATAVQLAIDVDEAIEQRESSAVGTARAASELLRSLADNVVGVTQAESAMRISFARDLATRVAGGEREIEVGVRDIARGMRGGESRSDSDGIAAAGLLSRQAEANAEVGKTVRDVLQSTLDAFDAESERAVARVGRVMEELDFDETIDRMTSLGGLIENNQWQDASVQAADIADRFDVAAEQLDAIHRDAVAPLVERLRAYEARAAHLKDQLARLETEDQVTRWHRRASALLEDLELGEIAVEPSRLLAEAMQEAGWNEEGRDRWDWRSGEDGNLIAPSRYDAATQGVIDAIQLQIQSLMLGDVLNAEPEAAPPQYRALIERFLEVLSADVAASRPKSQNSNNK